MVDFVFELVMAGIMLLLFIVVSTYCFIELRRMHNNVNQKDEGE